LQSHVPPRQIIPRRVQIVTNGTRAQPRARPEKNVTIKSLEATINRSEPSISSHVKMQSTSMTLSSQSVKPASSPHSRSCLGLQGNLLMNVSENTPNNS